MKSLSEMVLCKIDIFLMKQKDTSVIQAWPIRANSTYKYQLIIQDRSNAVFKKKKKCKYMNTATRVRLVSSLLI